MRSRLLTKDLERLEPYESKGSRTVLRGEWGSNSPDLPDYDDEDFEKRMFQYYYRIFDSYNQDIEALAVFTFKGDSNKSDKYERNFLKTRLLYEYRTYDIAKQEPEHLKLSENPFSLVALAAQEAINHKNNDDNNFNYRKRFLKLLLEKDFKSRTANEILNFVSFVFTINDPLKRDLYYKEAHEMALREGKLEVLTDMEEYIIEKRNKEIAKKMKTKGVDLETISEVTDLTKEQIEAL